MEKQQSKLQTWINKNDKFVHTWMSAIIVIITGLFFRYILSQDYKQYAATIAIFIGILIGGSWELIWDKLLGKGNANWLDFLADFFGCFTGFVILLWKFNN